MFLIKIGIFFFVTIINYRSFSVALSVSGHESREHKNPREPTCKKLLSQKPECAEIFSTVAAIKDVAPNRQEFLRKNSSFITADKYLIIGTEFFSSEEYCILNSIKESTAEVLVCKRNCYQNSTWRPCIPKCCPWGESVQLNMNTGHGVCEPSNELRYTWKPDIYNHKSYLQVLTEKDYKMGFNPHYYSVSKKNTCKSVWIWHSSPKFSFHMLQDGNVRWRYQTNKWFKVRSSRNQNYCFDKIENSEEQVLGICYSELVKSSLKYRKIYAGLAFVSAFFMFILLMMYLLLAKEQNSHGWIQFLFFLSLFFFHFLEGIGLLILPQDLQVKPICYVLSVTHHFFFTLTTVTLVTLSWDIFWTFWKLHPREGQQKCLQRFYISATVSCSSTFVLVLVGVLMNLMKSPYSIPYGLLFCTGGQWIVGKYFQLAFVLFSLMTLFATFFVVYKHKAATKILVADTRKFYKDLSKVFLKLLIVQGGTWTCIMGLKLVKHYQDRSRYNDIIHMIYYSQSLLLFILFAYDKRKLKSLEEKYPMFKGLSDALCSLCRRKIGKTGEDQPLVVVASRPMMTAREHK